MSRLADALKRRFASPEAALAHLGLDTSLLENGDNDMGMSNAAALAAVRALKKRGLVIAMDASSEEEAARVIQQEGGDRMARRPARDRNRAFPSSRDAEMGERERMEDCRGAVRRAADDADFDPVAVIEALMQNASPEEMSEIMQAMREISTDHRGPHAWAKDRREMRVSRDRMLTSRARKFGTGRDAFGPPNVGEGYRDPDRDIENFAQRRGESRREETGAFDLALDQGDNRSAVEIWLGPQAANINKV